MTSIRVKTTALRVYTWDLHFAGDMYFSPSNIKEIFERVQINLLSLPTCKEHVVHIDIRQISFMIYFYNSFTIRQHSILSVLAEKKRRSGRECIILFFIYDLIEPSFKGVKVCGHQCDKWDNLNWHMVNTADKTTAFYLMVHWLPGYNRPATLFLGHWTLYISIFTTFNLLDYATANYSLNLFRCIIKHLNLISLWISNATLFSVYGHCSRTTQPH